MSNKLENSKVQTKSQLNSLLYQQIKICKSSQILTDIIANNPYLMDKSYQPSHWEPIIRQKWEQDNANVAHVDEKEPFTIILPPPNANGSLHTGHAMYVYEDIMIRYARQQGRTALWLPGADHLDLKHNMCSRNIWRNKEKADLSTIARLCLA